MIAVRNARIEPFRVMLLLERAKQLEAAGHSVVHFEVGEPDFATAEHIIEAGARALEARRTHYTQATGIPDLKNRIAAYYAQRFEVAVAPERIIVTSGASGALLLLSALLIDPDREVLMTDPGYPCNRHFMTLVGARARLVPVDMETGFQLTGELVEASWGAKTAGVLAASPSNPTGAVLSTEEIAAIAEVCRRNNGALIIDEIYQGLTYGDDGSPIAALSVADDAFVINSFSKYFGMTGWRVGWCVVPTSTVTAIERLAQNLFISPPTLAQHAAVAAFDDSALAEHERRRAVFEVRRDRLHAGLTQLGFTVPLVPNGAFYLYVDISSTGLDSETFCQRLLEEFHVAATPGTDFGQHLADRYVRFAYTTSQEQIDLGLKRLADALVHFRSGAAS
jgi:aspartate/methionine/tyrosine aminotransferase